MDEIKLKNKFMKEALREAQKAYDKNEIPVGAVIVKDNKIIARAHNIKEKKKWYNKTCWNYCNTKGK